MTEIYTCGVSCRGPVLQDEPIFKKAHRHALRKALFTFRTNGLFLTYFQKLYLLDPAIMKARSFIPAIAQTVLATASIFAIAGSSKLLLTKRENVERNYIREVAPLGTV